MTGKFFALDDGIHKMPKGTWDGEKRNQWENQAIAVGVGENHSG